MGRVIDLTKLDGAHSLGDNFSKFVLGEEVKDALEKLLEAVKQGEKFSDKKAIQLITSLSMAEEEAGKPQFY